MKGVEREVEKEVEGWSERLSELNENQRKILNSIKNKPSISKTELAGKIGINPSAIQKNLGTLKKKGFLRRVGPARGGHWEILEKWASG